MARGVRPVRSGVKRASTVRGAWPAAVLENFYECPSDDPRQLEIWAYTDKISYGPGERVRLHVSTSAKRFDIAIVRDGLEPRLVYGKTGLKGRRHPTPRDCSVNGCGWPVAHSFVLPGRWPSGAYIVRTTAHGARGGREEHDHIFILRPGRRSRRGRLLLVASTCTWTAYNDWGGSNHYEGITGPERNRFSPTLSQRRPFSRGFVALPVGAPRIPLRQVPPPGAAPRYPHMEWAYANGYSKKYASSGWASYDRHFLRFAQSQGYPIDIVAQHDLERDPACLAGYPCIAFVGHDEYWSWPMRDAVDAYVAAGGRVARFAGNFMWQIRLDLKRQQQSCYKYRAAAEDPFRHGRRKHLTTTSWEAPIVGRPGALTFGLNATRGLYAGWGGAVPRGSGGFTVYRPDHWAFAGTDLYYGDQLGAASRVFGYEVDGVDYVIRDGLPEATGREGAPPGMAILAMGLASPFEADHANPGSVLFIGDEDVRFVAETLFGAASPEAVEKAKRGCGMMVHFRKGKGEVFHAGSVEWIAGLIDGDPQVARVTNNVLARFLR